MTDWPTTLFTLSCIFAAAAVRGYSGFGFSLLAVTSLSLAMNPIDIVPSIFLLEIAASLHLLPSIWRDIHWRSIGLLMMGCLLGTPVGVWFLTNVPAAPLQLALAIFVLISAWFLWRGYALQAMPGRIASLATGFASGALNGAFGVGGPPVILFYFASPAGAIAGRASIVAYFLATDLIGLAVLSSQALVSKSAVITAAVWIPALLAGVWLGSCSFKTADPKIFRKWVLIILSLLALISAVKGLWQIAASG